MPIIINNISSSLDASEKEIVSSALKSVGLGSGICASVYKTSLDARKRDSIHFVHSVYAELLDENEEKCLCEKYHDVKYAAPCRLDAVIGTEKPEGKVCIAGFGPAGMFCALVLAEHGYKPVIFERGADIETRAGKVGEFWNGGVLDRKSNVQFGEGGAGTFSDGKLTTRIKDPLCRYVLERFVAFGAPEEILTKAKPHIGTDKLRGVVKNLRERIFELGGEVRFLTQVDDLVLNGRKLVSVKAGECSVSCSVLVLATGHSARDTFEMLASKGIFLEPKPFSVGFRIEHLQSDVDRSLYGKYAGNPLLPRGEYQLSARDPSGRAVYTFCMCPGGTVVPAASDDRSVVTNGMSVFARDGSNANAAVAAAVSPDDFGHSPLDGMNFAAELERRAYSLSSSYKAPASTVGGFMSGRAVLGKKVSPSYAIGVEPVELDKLFPGYISSCLKYGLADFARKMQCFRDSEAMLTAPETRTSSPVRITRGDTLNSISVDNLFPCGEGAGYAGGIVSAAVDGIKVALEIMKRQAPE